MEIIQLIQKGIEERIKELIDLEIKEAKQRLEKQIRENTGLIASRVLEHFSMERFENQIKIVVSFPK